MAVFLLGGMCHCISTRDRVCDCITPREIKLQVLLLLGVFNCVTIII